MVFKITKRGKLAVEIWEIRKNDVVSEKKTLSSYKKVALPKLYGGKYAGRFIFISLRTYYYITTIETFMRLSNILTKIWLNR